MKSILNESEPNSSLRLGLFVKWAWARACVTKSDYTREPKWAYIYNIKFRIVYLYLKITKYWTNYWDDHYGLQKNHVWSLSFILHLDHPYSFFLLRFSSHTCKKTLLRLFIFFFHLFTIYFFLIWQMKIFKKNCCPMTQHPQSSSLSRTLTNLKPIFLLILPFLHSRDNVTVTP